MQVTVRLEQADVDALSELREWLLETDAVRRYARLRWADTTGSDSTGVGLDALQLVVGNGLSVRQLLVAIGEWQDSRESDARVLVSRRSQDGAPVVISALDPPALEDAIRALEGS
ncbi:MAG: hypothetical protein IRZ05_11130 [Micromonosporaceae bacterium]|nr:hypothetical protein [Micromonosporaceae bacterium]